MAETMITYSKPVCRGTWALGNNCKTCERCVATRPNQGLRPMTTTPEALERLKLKALAARIDLAACDFSSDFATADVDSLHALLATLEATQAAPESYQARVDAWVIACFGETIRGDKTERNHRFLEEALELVQSTGCTQSEAHQLVDYVFGRDVGDPGQEVGGVMNTLAALCNIHGLDLSGEAEKELARVWTKVEAIRAKQAAKPKHSPLPQHVPDAQADAEADAEADTDLYRHMLTVAKVNGFDSLTDAISQARNATATQAENVRLREIADLARELVSPKGMVNRGVDRGLVVIEKADKSDPHYRLCTALEQDARLSNPNRVSDDGGE